MNVDEINLCNKKQIGGVKMNVDEILEIGTKICMYVMAFIAIYEVSIGNMQDGIWAILYAIFLQKVEIGKGIIK